MHKFNLTTSFLIACNANNFNEKKRLIFKFYLNKLQIIKKIYSRRKAIKKSEIKTLVR